MKKELRNLRENIATLTIYQDVLENEVGHAFVNTLESFMVKDKSSITILENYTSCLRALIGRQQNWSDFLLEQILIADNLFTRQVQFTELDNIHPELINLVSHDLKVLQNLFNFSWEKLKNWLLESTISNIEIPFLPPETTFLPEDLNSVKYQDRKKLKLSLKNVNDWRECLDDFAKYYQRFGTGLMALYQAFRWQNGQLVGINHPDPIQLSVLVGYERQKEELINNTIALIKGYSALNVLLYGSRGSGKSSLVKGLLNEYHHQGLRLVEVSKSELADLPIIVEKLRELPQKLMIFVDDLSFEEDDDQFKAFKVVLEGSVVAKPQNVVVYATTNRRHLVREFFADRPRPQDGDEVHAWDTMEEKLSFSDRFGLTLTFEPADQSKYLTIVQHLAKEAKIQLDEETIKQKALQWQRRTNGRSGRTARQFVDYLKTMYSKN